jgi:hypothetical protein
MKTFKLIQLALMFPIILAGCATQLSHQPVLVVGGSESVNQTSDLVLGGDFDIPGLDLYPVPQEGSCEIEVRLEGVDYDGDNVGPLWSLSGTVNHTPWELRLKELQFGKWNPIDTIVFDHESNNCFHQLFFLSVDAQQVRFPKSDKGSESGKAWFMCGPQESERQVVVTVGVPGKLWPTPLQSKTKAELHFVFTIKTKCKT